MAYSPHILVAVGGQLNTSQIVPEIWQCGVRWAPSGGTTLADVDAFVFLEALVSPLSDWFSGAGTLVDWAPTPCNMQYAKCNKIGADGRYIDPVTNVHDYTTPPHGSLVGVQPDIIAGVATWRTARARPPGAFGRVYLPAYCGTPEGAGLISWNGTTQTRIADAGAGLLAAITAAASAHDYEGDVVVASRVNASLNPILHVDASNLMGVQRRRKSAIPETFVRSTLYP